MARIGSITNTGADQIRVLNRLTRIGNDLTDNTTRLSTLKRINSAKDDPAGLISATILERELTAAESASQSLTRAGSLLNTADKATEEIVNGLQSARALILASIGTGVSSSEVAANQHQIDTILGGINSLAQSEFGGQQLLNGASGFTTAGIDAAEIIDIDVLDKAPADDVVVDITIDAGATQATNSYTGGTLTADTTVVVDGPDGTTTINLGSGADTQSIADAFNAVSEVTGITATRIDAGEVEFETSDYGSAVSFSIEATEGSFTLTAAGTVSGTDATATINGQSVTGDGSLFHFHSSQVSFVAEVDPTQTGSLTSFAITGEGLSFVTGASPTDTVRIGLPALSTASLGGATGKLHTIISGGANSMTGGKAAEALKIVDEAIGDATRGRAIIGGFQKFTIESSSRVIGNTIESLSSSLSGVRDTDVAMETVLLANNQLLQQSVFQAASISNFKNSDVLDLIRRTATGF